ncbi:MAG: TolC family protein [Saprospiraceae bacterium]
MQKRNKYIPSFFIVGLALWASACAIPQLATKEVSTEIPTQFAAAAPDTANAAQINWRDFFDDPYLPGLIDTALSNNQELNIVLQRISVVQNEIQARKGEYLPFVNGGIGSDVEKVGRYTRNGAVEESLNITDDKAFPELLGNLQLGLTASWEVDIWHKLRNSQKIASMEYLASVEGKNFLLTNLVAEVANSYYELIALDNQLLNLEENIQIQKDALNVVKLLQQAGRTNSLAVQRFEAEVKKNQSEIFTIRQEITVTENRINFLLGRAPQPIRRNASGFIEFKPQVVSTGVPAQLLENRPDIRKAELELAASELNIQVARANFYPSLDVKAGLGFQAFNPKFLLSTPESVAFSLAGDALAPLVNRNAIIATYKNASAKQIEAAYEYEQVVLKAYFEVANQLSNMDNLEQNFQLKTQQVEALNRSIEIANQLFQSARADYMEVLLTQRDALEAKMELIETQKAQLIAMVDLYKALGGGWR